MSTIRVVLHFEEDDNNSMQLYQILQNIKRGKRATVLADNIMANLAEHNLLSTFGSSPEAMASLLTALSTNYRMGIAPQPVSNSSAPPTQVQQTKKKPKKNIPKQNGISKLEDIAPVETSRVVQQVSEPAVAEQESVLAPSVKSPAPIVVVHSETPSDGKTYLDEDDWKEEMINAARDYILAQSPDDYSRNELEETWRMRPGDLDSRYENMVADNVIFLNPDYHMPDGYDSFENYLAEQLNNNNLYLRGEQ